MNIGPASSGNAFSLSPQTTVELPLTGRLIPQSSQDGLAAVSQMFNSFLHGKDSNITVQGDSAGPTDVGVISIAGESFAPDGICR